MSMIRIEQLSFSYPSSCDPVFENVNLQMDTDWKLGLVGRNGRGKTTLLNLLLGKYEYKGRIIHSVSFEYFPYPVPEPGRPTGNILAEICPSAEEWQLLRELSYLDVREDVLQRSFETLSQGEQTKVLLAALFLRENHFLLIDEPTNHLDARTRELVAAYLNRKQGFLLVSHDRYFLDACVDHVLSLNRYDIDLQSGTFSSFLQNAQRRQSFELAQNERLQKDIDRLKRAAQRTSGWADRVETSKYGNGPVDRGYVGHRSAKMMKRSKAIVARQQEAVEQKAGLLKHVEEIEALKLSPLGYHADTLLSVSEVCIHYSPTPVCGPISFAVHRGERIALDGRNGSGKSSLLKLLIGESIPHTGIVTVGSGLIISYVSQTTSHLKGLLSDFASKHRLDESLLKAILRKLGFERAQWEKDMADFSAGQKKKVLLAKSLCEPAHLYLWDEPLNFIDIDSRMQVEQLLDEYSPTMLFIEHDRVFRDRIATKVISLSP